MKKENQKGYKNRDKKVNDKWKKVYNDNENVTIYRKKSHSWEYCEIIQDNYSV